MKKRMTAMSFDFALLLTLLCAYGQQKTVEHLRRGWSKSLLLRQQTEERICP